MPAKVCAVVVTYNRKKLLLRALAALQRQTYPLQRILIIDNASTDGTAGLLQERGILADKLFEFLSLPDNQGGAGGFAYGILAALKRGYEQIYLMDDDGYPADDSLACLMAFAAPGTCLGSLIIDAEHPDQLCFPLRLPGTSAVMNSLDDLKKAAITGTVDNLIIPFNGVLLPSAVVNKLGSPQPSYFIWGDDMEYIWRLARHGVKLKTIVKAKFYHPRAAAIGTPMLWGRVSFNDTESLLKLYCMCRNNTVNLLTYKSAFLALAFAFKVIWFYSITRPDRKKLRVGIRGLYHGWRRDFKHHRDYLC